MGQPPPDSCAAARCARPVRRELLSTVTGSFAATAVAVADGSVTGAARGEDEWDEERGDGSGEEGDEDGGVGDAEGECDVLVATGGGDSSAGPDPEVLSGRF